MHHEVFREEPACVAAQPLRASLLLAGKALPPRSARKAFTPGSSLPLWVPDTDAEQEPAFPPLQFSPRPYDVGAVVPILQRRKLRLREAWASAGVTQLAGASEARVCAAGHTLTCIRQDPGLAPHTAGAQFMLSNTCAGDDQWSEGSRPGGAGQGRTEPVGPEPSCPKGLPSSSRPIPGLGVSSFICSFIGSHPTGIQRALLRARAGWGGEDTGSNRGPRPDTAPAGEAEPGPEGGKDRGLSCGESGLGRRPGRPLLPYPCSEVSHVSRV